MGIHYWPSILPLHSGDKDTIRMYSEAGLLVGRIRPDLWEIGDLTTPGLRATVDPIGGIRFRSTSDRLLSLVDQQGMAIRDETTGLIVADYNRSGLHLNDTAGGNPVVLSSASAATLFTPRYTSVTEAVPSSSIVIPAATLLGTNDFELGHTAAYLRGTVQVGTHTPPAGWTEVIENDYGLASTLANSVNSRGVATGTTGTVTSSQTNWESAIGTHMIIKGTVGGTTPTIRATNQAEVTSTAANVPVTVTKPAGTAAGDVLVLFVSMGNALGSIPTGWTTPEGWIFIGAQVIATGSGATLSTLAVGVWAKLAGASEPASYTTNINFATGTKTIHACIVAVQNGESIPGGPQFNIGGYNLAGAWRSYTPTTTGITMGNSTLSGGYLLMGKTCFVRISFVFGASGAAITAPVRFGLPFTGAALPSSHEQTIVGSCIDISAVMTQQLIGRILGSSTTCIPIHDEMGASFGEVTTGAPFTWAAGDSMNLTGLYEIP